MKRTVPLFVLVVCLVVALGVGVVVGRLSYNPLPKVERKAVVNNGAKQTRLKANTRLTSILLECDNFNPSDIASLSSLRSKLKGYVRNAKQKGTIEELAVYYRDLNNGPWIGISEDNAFSPASLLKVTLKMAAFKHAEASPEFLSKQVVFTEGSLGNFTPNIRDETIQLGRSYTIEELIESMIIHSDNHAMHMVMTELEAVNSDKTIWTDIGLEVPTKTTPADFLSVKQYSTFFRILYNSTYLSHANSEKALEILTRSNEGLIRAGLPQNIIVASKFGERGITDSDANQLHECGIVYDKDSPYLLCVMTRGTDWQTQADVISEISRIVFEER